VKANKAAAKVFKEYLVEKGLNSHLMSHFYINARKCDGSHKRAILLERICHGLNRYLKIRPFQQEI